MSYLMIEDCNTGDRGLVSIEEAERRSTIDRLEIEWAIEEYGVCESVDHIITDTRDAQDIIAA